MDDGPSCADCGGKGATDNGGRERDARHCDAGGRAIRRTAADFEKDEGKTRDCG